MASCPSGSGYDPSAAVEAFHGIPHADIDLQNSPDEFDPASTEYWEVSSRESASSCPPAHGLSLECND